MMNYQKEIDWLKAYLVAKPWASWARRQLAEIRREMAQEASGRDLGVEAIELEKVESSQT